MLGVGYKRNHEDARESPGLRLMAMLEAAGAEIQPAGFARTELHVGLAQERSQLAA